MHKFHLSSKLLYLSYWLQCRTNLSVGEIAKFCGEKNIQLGRPSRRVAADRQHALDGELQRRVSTILRCRRAALMAKGDSLPFASILVDSVGPTRAEVCRTAASFP